MALQLSKEIKGITGNYHKVETLNINVLNGRRTGSLVTMRVASYVDQAARMADELLDMTMYSFPVDTVIDLASAYELLKSDEFSGAVDV